MSKAALTPKEFIAKWAAVSVNEIAVAQSHFRDLCALLDILAPYDDPTTQASYRFEQPLSKAGGGAGRADVWHAGKFVWEYKSKGKNLAEAYQQLTLYRSDLGNPPVLIVSDIERYIISIEFTGTPTRRMSFTNADLINQATRDLLRDALTHPERLKPAETTISITQEAAQKLVEIAQLLEQRYPAEQVAHFFVKLLFALFAEDISLLPDQLLTNSLRAAIQKPATIQGLLKSLFETMNTGGFFGTSFLPCFNGALFADEFVPELNADELQLLHEAAKLDWSAVEPSIFGTLFERALDPSKRSQLGAHYTSEADILLIVEPVLMQPLRREWAQVQAQVQRLLESRKQSDRSKAQAQLEEFVERLATLRV
ncbi:MAG: class I SAM-dependent DNA methyltransferase, partial [Chloroflexaceae bacterium]|nr:class I SAM-dependent DNA methyltransferase [Chloroflexaceae bacterium]